MQGNKKESEKGGSTSTEVRSNGSSPAKIVYVTYHGPERLTRRFSRFFEIAADDYGIKIADKERGADAFMSVQIAEDETEERLTAHILRVGFVLREGKSATVEDCESIGGDGDKDSYRSLLGILYPSLTGKNIASGLKKRYPSVLKTYVDPIKGNVEPYMAEVIREELVKADYIPMQNAKEADAVLRTMGATSSVIKMHAVKQHLSINISGSAKFKYDGDHMIYKSISQPYPANASACKSNAESYLQRSGNSDDSWNGAVAAVKSLAKQ
jgi:hypothetical protein